MIEAFARTIQPILQAGAIRKTRRNHALEHATIHLLRGHRLSGRSDSGGFIVMGEVDTDRLERAAHDALGRMKRGQADLAVHPNCGTNLVTTGFLATLVAALGFAGSKRDEAWERFPLVMLGMMGVALYSLPIGMSLQKHITTEGDLGDMEIVSVTRRDVYLPIRQRPLVVHHVITKRA
jgi:hypothetical protein